MRVSGDYLDVIPATNVDEMANIGAFESCVKPETSQYVVHH